MTQWYDAGLAPRTWRALTIAAFVSGALAPHASTVRWSYTVPSNKAARVTMLQCEVNRYTAPSAAGIYQGAIRLNNTTILIARNWRTDVGVSTGWVIGHNVALLTGQVLDAVTVDTSSGGSVTYNLAAIIVEAP